MANESAKENPFGNCTKHGSVGLAAMFPGPQGSPVIVSLRTRGSGLGPEGTIWDDYREGGMPLVDAADVIGFEPGEAEQMSGMWIWEGCAEWESAVDWESGVDEGNFVFAKGNWRRPTSEEMCALWVTGELDDADPDAPEKAPADDDEGGVEEPESVRTLAGVELGNDLGTGLVVDQDGVLW